MLRCRICEGSFPLRPLAACPLCEGPLDVAYARPDLVTSCHELRAGSVWRYQAALPHASDKLSLGMTPLVPAARLSELLGVELSLKLETANPTHSFKDRLAASAVAAAEAFGLQTLCCVSAGNLGEAVTAACRVAGLEAVVLAPIGEARGDAIAVSGDIDDCRRLERALESRLPWGFVEGNLAPFAVEGAKTVAFEIAEQLDWRPPDAVVSPLASGTLFAKIAQGFAELGGPLPQLIGGQPAGCPPLAAAFLEQRRPSRVTPRTAARSLAVGDPRYGELALGSARVSGGAIRAVPEERIRSYSALLAETTGVFADSAAGVALGALLQCLRDGTVAEGSRVVLVVTGTPARRAAGSTRRVIAASADAFLAAYGS
ncbi:MAG TPA: pyridoxal-phosphate dependent enzyme [Gaiellaceae bacterium]|nr:pyridoxal-phosphate dependent enzyme [Gaiellaceae bacterium]